MDERRKPGRPARVVEETRKRRPMSTGTSKLSLPDYVVKKFWDDGYRLYWMRDDAGRVEAAREAGYELVKADETTPNEFITPGNSDLGTNISRISGANDLRENNQPVRLILMKIKREWYEEDQASLAATSDMIENRIRLGDAPPSNGQGPKLYGGDAAARYVKSAVISQRRGRPA